MLRLGKAIVKEYPQLNASLLYAGIIIHDLGKHRQRMKSQPTSKSMMISFGCWKLKKFLLIFI
jgi:23S rRNA maturation-related 3'-5' exoribonuclease YhaM